jgi:hypothetical protein
MNDTHKQYEVRYISGSGIYSWYKCTAASPAEAEKKCRKEHPYLRHINGVSLAN